MKIGDLIKYSSLDEDGMTSVVPGQIVAKLSKHGKSKLGLTKDNFIIKLFISREEINVFDCINAIPLSIRLDIKDTDNLCLEKDCYEGSFNRKDCLIIVPSSSSIIKPVTIKEKNISFFKEIGICTKCAHKGEWISLALFCPFHGKIVG